MMSTRSRTPGSLQVPSVVLAACDERKELGSWIAAGTVSYRGEVILSIKGSSPVSALDCVSVGERAPNYVLGWAGDAGDGI